MHAKKLISLKETQFAYYLFLLVYGESTVGGGTVPSVRGLKVDKNGMRPGHLFSPRKQGIMILTALVCVSVCPCVCL